MGFPRTETVDIGKGLGRAGKSSGKDSQDNTQKSNPPLKFTAEKKIKIRMGKPNQQERRRRREELKTDLPTQEAKTLKEAEARGGERAACRQRGSVCAR